MIKTTFSASRISELLAKGTGKTAQNYVLDLALQSLGIKDEFDSKEMKHGRVNQYNAYQNVIYPLYKEAVWHDEYIPINDYMGASPDCLIGNIPVDIKCPFYPDNFIEQINSVPKKYFAQSQMQMMATKSDKGLLCFYLTKPEEWGEEDNWEEYPFPLSMRFKVFEFAKDEQLQSEILEAVEKHQPLKDRTVKLLGSAIELEPELFFYEQINGYAYRDLKSCSYLFELEGCFKVNNKFYYKK